MKLNTLAISGYFEEEDREVTETLQLLEPENELEKNLICWSILPAAQTVADNPARGASEFEYQLHGYLKNGLYRLDLLSRGPAGVEAEVEIAAAMVARAATISTGRPLNFTPYWFVNRRLYFKPLGESIHERYLGSSYGHLRFGRSACLPHRRLFPLAVAGGGGLEEE